MQRVRVIMLGGRGGGGGAKVALHREIAVGIVLIGASHMVDYLATKFQDKKEPQLHSERD